MIALLAAAGWPAPRSEMSQSELTKPYEPNPLLRAVYQRFFDRIKVDETWIQNVRLLAEQGVVVYVLRSLNVMDFLALDHLTKRYELPRIHFVNDLGLWVLNPSVGRSYRAWVHSESHADRLRNTIRNGGSAVLFLKRPPSALDVAAGASGGRGLREGEQLVQALFDEQRQSERPILLLPQVFVWTRRPDTRGTGTLDLLLGPREWPSAVRTAAQLLQNYPRVELRVGEPLNLSEFIKGSGEAADPVRIRRATYAMLRRLERERRSVTGPAQKSPERVRQEILRTPKLRAAIQELAGDKPEERRVLTRQALRMLRGLQATPHHATLDALDVVFHRVLHRIYAGIDYDTADLQRVREASKDQTLVLLPSHKSHVDYIILSYIFKQEGLPLPVIAAGENLNFFPMGPVLRRAGAFFIRRSFKGDQLYGSVVDAYVRRLIRDGYPIELFLEGGRSRTGKLLPPKYGLLNMIVDAALSLPQKPTCFVPISIGYERVVEAGEYERELKGGDKEKEDAAALLQTRKVLRHRYGRINLQVGRILSLGDLREELALPTEGELGPAERRSIITRLGNRVLDEINRVTAVTPGGLTALALLSHPHDGLSHAELHERCSKLLGVLRSMGARVTPATADPAGPLRSAAILEAAQMFMDAELLEAHPAEEQSTRKRRRRTLRRAADDAFYTVPVNKRLALDTSKNIIIHFFVERGLVSLAVLASGEVPAPLEAVRSRVQDLSRLLKYEFRFHAGATFDEIFDDTIRTMLQTGELRLTREGEAVAGPGMDGWTGQQWLRVYAAILQNFVEGCRIAARGLAVLVKGAMSKKELVKKALSTGTRMFLTGEIRRREAVSMLIIENAYHALRDQQYLQETDGKLELAESYRSQEAVDAIEEKIASFLSGEGQ